MVSHCSNNFMYCLSLWSDFLIVLPVTLDFCVICLSKRWSLSWVSVRLARGSLVSESSAWSLALILIHAFVWFIFLLLHFSCCFACFPDTHTQMPIRPNSIISPTHPPHPSIHCTPQTHLPSRCKPRADRSLRSTRSMGGAAHTAGKLVLPDLPPGSGQARGLSAGTHPSPDQPAVPPCCHGSQTCLMLGQDRRQMSWLSSFIWPVSVWIQFLCFSLFYLESRNLLISTEIQLIESLKLNKLLMCSE